ncbi:MAG: glycosyltransferase family 1 protein [Christensenellaceae bacterium]
MKKIEKIVIEGISISNCTKITGIERVCREILLRLDKSLAKEIPVEYVFPKYSKHGVVKPEEFENIKCVELHCKLQRVARYLALPRYVRKHNALCVCLPLELLYCKGRISSIYDLRSIIYKNFDTQRSRTVFKRILFNIKHFSKAIVTDSDYQKNEIIKRLKINPNKQKVYTVYPGWEHLKDLKIDETIFEKFSQIKKSEYFYSLGSLAPHKNFKWVMEVAKRNPDKKFVIAGGKDLKIWKEDISTTGQENLVFTGYVSDEENKSLMTNCKAFIFPSLYEGFGIPPLEALLCGAKVLCSNATCLPEVYEDTVVYFDPYDYDVDIEKLLQQPVADPEKIFEKCSWEKAAEKWREIILEQIELKPKN